MKTTKTAADAGTSTATGAQGGSEDSRHTRRLGRRGRLVLRSVGLLTVMALVAGVVTAAVSSPDLEARANATPAVKALRDGDLPSVGEHLAANLGDRGFAYYFTKDVTPRDLGDALATVADPDQPSGLKADVNAADYDQTLTDLAGTLALATNGVGDWVLPESWTKDFTTYTTTPDSMCDNQSSDDGSRVNQDLANKQNLLLLLPRGAWSNEFLQATTGAYWDWEHAASSADTNPWPGTTLEDATYAPTPDGTYLTDGTVALMAALTDNPEAAYWAFKDFQPGTTTIKFGGDDHQIGNFAHYAFFEHDYAKSPETGTDDVGLTASFAALTSATQSTLGAYDDDVVGPQADAQVLSNFAAEAAKPWYRRLGNEIRGWGFKEWGHLSLDLGSVVLAFAAPYIGGPAKAAKIATSGAVAADAANAAWYAVDGDWKNAGLSVAFIPVEIFGGRVLAKALRGPGKAADDLAKAGSAADDLIKGGAVADDLVKGGARAGSLVDEGVEAGSRLTNNRVYLRVDTKAKIQAAAPKTAAGEFIDPNTGKVIPHGEQFHYGHMPGYEFWRTKETASTEGWTRPQMIDYENDWTHYQIEDPHSNMSHVFEKPR